MKIRCVGSRAVLCAMAAMVLTAGCFHDDKKDPGSNPPPPPPPPATYSVGGSVSGLVGTGLVLRNNGGNDLPVSTNSTFTFSTQLNSGSGYAVTVGTQPSNPAQTCVVANGSGTIASANVANVTVTCTTNTFTLSGSVSGLNGAGLVLQNNGGDDLNIASNGGFTFATAINPGSSFAVTVRTQPSGPIQQCSIANGSGANVGANITNVSVTCADIVPRFVHSMNFNQGTISTFRVDAANGELRAVRYSKLGTQPISFRVVPSPNNSNKGFFYALNAGSQNITAAVVDRYIDPANRVVEGTIAGSPFALPAAPANFISHPNNRFLYVTHTAAASISAFAIDETTGVLTPIAGSPFATGPNPSAITLSADGQFAYVPVGSGHIYVYGVNASTGVLTEQTALRVATGTTPLGLSITTDGRYGYLANTGSNNVSGYAINASTGALTPLSGSPYGAGTNPNSVIYFHPNGRFAYVTNATSNNFSAFAINTASGVLTALGGSPYATGATPVGVLFDPSARFMYVPNRNGASISVFAVDANTGIPTAVGSPVSAPPSPRIAVEASGKYLYAAGNGNALMAAYRINQRSGALTPTDSPLMTTGAGPIFAVTALSSTTPVTAIPRFAFVANDGGVGNGSIQAYAINSTTGAATAFGSPLSTAVTPTSVASTPDGKFVYAVNEGSDSISRYASNAGTLTLLGTTPTAAAPHYITVDASGRFAYVADDDAISVYSIGGDGALTAVGAPVSIGGYPEMLALDHNGRCLFATNNSGNSVAAFTVNADTGTLTQIAGSPFSAGSAPVAIAIHPTGRQAYVVNDGDNTVIRYAVSTLSDPPPANTCALSNSPAVMPPTPTSPAAFGATSIAIEPTGRFVYIGNEAMGTVSVMAVDLSNGRLSLVGTPVNAGVTVANVAADPSGRFLYVTSTPSVGGVQTVTTYNINAATGAITPASGTPLAAPSANALTIVGELQQ